MASEHATLGFTLLPGVMKSVLVADLTPRATVAISVVSIIEVSGTETQGFTDVRTGPYSYGKSSQSLFFGTLLAIYSIIFFST